MAIPIRKRLLTNDEFRQMVETGIFSPEERLELIHGEIVDMGGIGNQHASCLRRLIHLFRPLLGPEIIIDVQDPISLPEQRSQPRPDLVLLRPQQGGYAQHPTAADVLLLVEISDSSLAYDRGVKVPLYACCGIPEVWLIDVAGGAIVVHRAPGVRRYREIRSLRAGDTLAPAALPDARLAVAAILG